MGARLLQSTPFLQKALLTNSGAEAVRAAIKFALRATGRCGLVHCAHGFHGLSYGPLSLNGEAIFRDGFGPLLPDCFAIPFNDLAALEKILAGRQIAAFIVEPIQGKGVHVPDDDYLAGAQHLCRKYGTGFVVDEIQTGLGRTGRFLAIDHYRVDPYMLLLAKTLSAGQVPVAAVLTRKWIFEKVFNCMDRAVVHGSTFGSNNLAMAAALATLEVIEAEGLVDNAARLGTRRLAAVSAMAPPLAMVHAGRGKAPTIATAFRRPRSLKLQAAWTLLETVNVGLFCQLITIPLFKDHKILVQVAGHANHTVKLLPALGITDGDCEWI